MSIRTLFFYIILFTGTNIIQSMKNAQDDTLQTVANQEMFILAAECGNHERVAEEINCGVDIRATRDRYGYNAIFLAAMNGHSKCLKLILNAVIKKYPKEAYTIICAEDNQKQTPLQCAQDSKHTDCVTVLQEAIKKAKSLSENQCHDIKMLFESWLTSQEPEQTKKKPIIFFLCSVAQEGRLEDLIQTLQAVKENFKSKSFHVIDGKYEDMTPLMYAAQSNHLECVNALLKADADPTILNLNGQAACFFTTDHQIKNRLCKNRSCDCRKK